MAKDFTWKDEYSVHIEVIDSQHKKLILIISNLFNAINTQSMKEELRDILDELVEYTHYHFSTEEKWFQEFGYEKTEEHIAQHRLFSKKIHELQKKSLDNEVIISFELIDFLEDWLIGHIARSDQQYVVCFKSHGIE